MPSLADQIIFSSYRSLIKLSNKKLVLPFYHTVSDSPLPHIKHLYQVKSKAEFESDLDFLLKNYEPIDLDELTDITLNGAKVSKPVFHLTFDDGLRELDDIIIPILERKGIPATLFINSAFVDNKELFYRHKVSLLIEHLTTNPSLTSQISIDNNPGGQSFSSMKQFLLQLNYNDSTIIDACAKQSGLDFGSFLKNEQPYLTSIQIKNLISRGFRIAAHSVNHPHFKDVSIAVQKEQVAQCFTYLEEHFELSDRYFSFPFSDQDVSSEFFQWMYDDAGCLLSFGTSGLKDDSFRQHIHRVPMERGPVNARSIMRSQHIKFFFKALLNRNKIKRT